MIGSNGLADARHFLAPVAWFEDRDSAGYQMVTKFDGSALRGDTDTLAVRRRRLARQLRALQIRPRKVQRARHGDLRSSRSIAFYRAHLPAMTITADRSRTSWFFRRAGRSPNTAFARHFTTATPPPSSTASSRTRIRSQGFEPGCAFLTPLLTAHGISTRGYEAELERPDAPRRDPRRLALVHVRVVLALPFDGVGAGNPAARPNLRRALHRREEALRPEATIAAKSRPRSWAVESNSKAGWPPAVADRGSHGPGRADFPHPVRQVTGSLRDRAEWTTRAGGSGKSSKQLRPCASQFNRVFHERRMSHLRQIRLTRSRSKRRVPCALPVMP